MKYPELFIEYRSNKQLNFCGWDNPKHCKSFSNFKHQFTYNFNSRGYRDEEWPEDLSDCIFVVGASSVQGSGLPVELSFPKVLEQLSNRRVITVSLYSASNDWTLRMIKYIQKEINPKWIVAHWAQLHRRESNDTSLSDAKRRIENSNESSNDDFIHFANTIEYIKKQDNVINVLLPIIHNANLVPFLHCNFIPEIEIIDKARDDIHYGIKTSMNIAKSINDTLFGNTF